MFEFETEPLFVEKELSYNRYFLITIKIALLMQVFANVPPKHEFIYIVSLNDKY